MNLNNQRWNHFICSNTGNLLIILIGSTLSYFWIKSQVILSDIFNDHEKLLLTYDLLQLFINLIIPLYMYWRDTKLLKYLFTNY